MDALVIMTRARRLVRMDTSKENLHRLEGFQAWQMARSLATRAYRVTQKPTFKEHAWLTETIRCAALETPSHLASGHEAPRTLAVIV